MSLDHNTVREWIEKGNTSLGIELGPTRIKAVLTGEDHTPITSGSHDWENRYVDHIWTYTLEDIWTGIQDCYVAMTVDMKDKHSVILITTGSIEFSATTHGYMVFNKEGDLLTPLRAWRNTITGPASEKLAQVFHYNMSQRWSIVHLYQAILNREERVREIDHLITPEGCMYWKLAGRKVLGISDMADVFPMDIHTKDFDQKRIDQFNELATGEHSPWKLRNILSKTLVAGEDAGILTEEGAKLLDISGSLKAGIPMYPPGGDAGTGMATTNSVAVCTSNVPAGTSVLATMVLEKELEHVYPEIGLVAMPASDMVATVHRNSCTSNLNAWMNPFKEFLETMGMKTDMNDLSGVLYNKALERDSNCGGLLAYSYSSREHIAHSEEGRSLFMRMPNSKLSLANFMGVHPYTSLGALKTGMDILLKEEHVEMGTLLGHGGLFKTRGVGQRTLAGAMNVSVPMMEMVGEDGTRGIALLIAFMRNKRGGQSLDRYLADQVFGGDQGTCVEPVEEDVEGFKTFMEQYAQGLATEWVAVDHMRQME